MTNPENGDDTSMTEFGGGGAPDDTDLPGGVTEEFRDVTDDDLLGVGTNQSTLGEASGGVDDLDDDLDDDLTPLDDLEDDPA